MERKLLKSIMNPAMIAVWILGPLLAWLTGTYMDTWLQIKFILVIAMSGVHGLYVRCWRDFANDRNTSTARLLPYPQRGSGGFDGVYRHSGRSFSHFS